MKSDAITVERFFTEHASALELNLVAGASGLKRIIREPTVNRPGELMRETMTRLGEWLGKA